MIEVTVRPYTKIYCPVCGQECIFYIHPLDHSQNKKCPHVFSCRFDGKRLHVEITFLRSEYELHYFLEHKTK